MTCKKALAVIISVFTVLSLTACKDNSVNEAQQDASSDNIIEEITGSDFIWEVQATSFDINEEDTEVFVPEQSLTILSTAVPDNNPSILTKAEIVDIYKRAAQNSTSSVKSQHSVSVTEISINNEELSGGFDFIKRIISTFISDNSEDTQGITGGYQNLTESDVYAAKAYAVGENTVIEMVMHEQTDGAKGNVHSGSVGHAIDVVGDISVVTNELKKLGLPIEISSENTTIHYTSPVVKVLVDSNGRIIKGTWRYTVEIRLNKFKAFGSEVENASIIMDNVITVNGGY